MIQDLNQKLEDQLVTEKAQLEARDHHIDKLEQRLAALEKLMEQANQQGD